MGYLVWVRVELSLGQVIFRVKLHFRSIWLGSGEFRLGSTSGQSTFGPISLSCKNKQFYREFWVGFRSAGFRSVWVLGSLSGEPISDVRCSLGSDCSGFGSRVNLARSNVHDHGQSYLSAIGVKCQLPPNFLKKKFKKLEFLGKK